MASCCTGGGCHFFVKGIIIKVFTERSVTPRQLSVEFLVTIVAKNHERVNEFFALLLNRSLLFTPLKFPGVGPLSAPNKEVCASPPSP